MFTNPNKINFKKVRLGAIQPMFPSKAMPFASLIPAKLPKFPPVYNVAQTMSVDLVGYLNGDLCGNGNNSNCVVVGSRNQIIHAEFAEQQRIIREITTEQVLDQYYLESGGRDIGLMPETHFEVWRTKGLNLGGQLYKINGHANINIKSFEELKASCNWLYGAQVCCGLPLNAQRQWNGKRRRYEWFVADGKGSELNSWGCHMMYCCGYIDLPGIGQWVLLWTWGQLIWASLAWYQKYTYTSTAILDQKDGWVDQSKVDFGALENYYKQLKGAI